MIPKVTLHDSAESPYDVRRVCVCQDGTVKLWEYKSGRRLQSWDLSELEDTKSSDLDKKKVNTAFSS